ncbi:MAG: NAD(P)H-binding protein [Chloroflexota bacterium]
MKLTLIGATGGVGAELLRQALSDGHVVSALVRRPEGLEDVGLDRTVVGDIRDADAVSNAVAGSEVVLWAVGATKNSADQVPVFETGARVLVEAMRAQGVHRLVALSGAAIPIPGERKPLSGLLMSAIVRVAARHVYLAKLREYEVFSRSGLDWTLVRPPRVVEGARTGRVVIGDRLASSQVTQGDVADAMLRLAADPAAVRTAPFVSTPG